MNEMDSSTNTADTNNKKHADNYDDDDDDDDGMVPVTRWALEVQSMSFASRSLPS